MFNQRERNFDIRFIGNHLNFHPGTGCRLDKVFNSIAGAIPKAVIAVLTGKVLSLGGFIKANGAIET